MMDLSFVQLASDPNLIPGVYNGCDQWCDYCPVTARCRAFKCQPSQDGGDLYDAVNAVSEYTELGTDDSAFFVGASVASYCPEHETAIS